MGDMQQMAMMQPQNPMQQPKEIANMFKNEKEMLELAQHTWALKEIEIQLLQKYHRIPQEDLIAKKNL